MIGFESWMRCPCGLDSNKNKTVSKLSRERALFDRRLWGPRFRGAAALFSQPRLRTTDRLPPESSIARTIERCRRAICEKARRALQPRGCRAGAPPARDTDRQAKRSLYND